MNNYDPIKFTQRYVFGNDTDSNTEPLSTGNDYNDHIRPLTGFPKPQAFEFDMLDYLTNGAGRYATPTIFPLVDQFFDASTDILTGTYSGTAAIRNALGFGDPSDEEAFKQATGAAIWQYGTDTLGLDFAERAYLFGTTGFTLDLTNANFIVGSNGEKSITGMRVKADPDNFDFVGGAGPVNKVANLILVPAYDPYGLGRAEVPINFTTSTEGREYGTSANPYNFNKYSTDEIYETLFTSIAGTASGKAKLATGIANLLVFPTTFSPYRAGSYLSNIKSDSFLSYIRNNSQVIYGTPGNDNLDFQDERGSRPVDRNFPSYLMVGGDGNDRITSNSLDDELLGGDDHDVLEGGGGDDTLNGGAGNDNLDGGTGEDIAVFSDDFENYDYAISQDKTTNTFGHNRGTQTDGVDTLKNIEWGQFGGNSNPNLSGPPNLIPLPLEDGVKDIEAVRAIDNTVSPNPNDPPTPPNVTITAPVAMLDGNVDYTLNISPYKPDTQYNISYILDTSASMDSGELQQAKNAYTDLTNYFINSGLAENINFGVVKFSRNATFRDTS
jgi:RTX calcium-binding nonapeptide repeat (4 copies)